MSLSSPQPLDANHRLDGFDCGHAVLNDWLGGVLQPAPAASAASDAEDDVTVGDEPVLSGESVASGVAPSASGFTPAAAAVSASGSEAAPRTNAEPVAATPVAPVTTPAVPAASAP